MTWGKGPGAGGTAPGAKDRISDAEYGLHNQIATPRQYAVLPDHPQARKILVDRIAAELADTAINAALAEYPDLGANGFGPIGVGDFDRAQIATAMLFLLQCGKTAPKRGDSSYSLKHRIERWGRREGISPYVANGCAIVAATALGFPMHRYEGSPNPWIGVRGKDVDRLTKPRGRWL